MHQRTVGRSSNPARLPIVPSPMDIPARLTGELGEANIVFAIYGCEYYENESGK